jgi:phosphopentomutase
MRGINRVVLIVLDSVGAGSLPDAKEYGDEGASTLAHVADAAGGLNVPRLQRLGLGNIIPIPGVPPDPVPMAAFGKMREASKGKDTIAGHWELMGIALERAFSLFPRGFSKDMIAEFVSRTGAGGILGNKPASGTEIIQELGEEHIRTAFPIVYTSGDSVFQIAAHEDVISIDRLYGMCVQARHICDKHQIGRVIARPFVGRIGAFTRTANRRDFPMLPPRETVLDLLERGGWPVVGIGKIDNIFANRGISRSVHTNGNSDGMKRLASELETTSSGLIFINLIDFDMAYGHRNDARGYAGALEAFDSGLGALLAGLGETDVLMITADHGCDPTYPGTDHTREYVPLLVYGKQVRPVDLGVRSSFCDVGASILEMFGIGRTLPGRSFYPDIFP